MRQMFHFCYCMNEIILIILASRVNKSISVTTNQTSVYPLLKTVWLKSLDKASKRTSRGEFWVKLQQPKYKYKFTNFECIVTKYSANGETSANEQFHCLTTAFYFTRKTKTTGYNFANYIIVLC